MHNSRLAFGSISFVIAVVFIQVLQCHGNSRSQIFSKPNSSRSAKKHFASSTDTKGRLREERFFFINFNEDLCTNDSGESGVCMKSSTCTRQGGTSGGSCAQGFGTCCTLTKACNGELQTVTYNGTRLVQQATGSMVDSCRYIIPKQPGVCQIRLDFTEFNIDEGPNAQAFGQCSTDTFDVSGNTNGMIGHLCGNLVGQHMYLDYGQNMNINLDISLASNMGQNWNILVTMIKCDSSEKAPDGCLQYFTGQRGKVKSFNFNVNKHQLNDQDYSVCVRANPGMKKITWKTCGTDIYDFDVSGPMPGLCPPNPPPGCEPIGAPENGTCSTDWVMIYGDNKYCGSGFPDSVVSMTQPFMMQVHFDHWELPIPPGSQEPDDENSGFCLMYSQSAF